MVIQSNDPYVKVTLDQIKEFDPEVLLSCGVEKGQTRPPRCKGCIAKNPICRRTNEHYSKDISKKVRANLKKKMKRRHRPGGE